MTPLLEVSGIRKSFGGFAALDGVSFGLAEGVIAGLIGPNGAGKTTLFNTLAGLLTPDAGGATLGGKALTGSPEQACAAGLARTFQIPRPFPEMTVLENTMCAAPDQAGERFWLNWLAPGRVAAEERALRETAEGVLDYCNLTRVAGDPARTLSGGQLKLLELARVLMRKPRIILLDEPAAGVNPALMEELVARIADLNARGQTFLIIEHNMDVVMRHCRPILVMAQGRLIFEGDAEGARADPGVLDAYLGDLP